MADTNAHRIRVVDLKTKAVSTLKLQGVTSPAPGKSIGIDPASGDRAVSKKGSGDLF